jgi:hypothetical protein
MMQRCTYIEHKRWLTFGEVAAGVFSCVSGELLPDWVEYCLLCAVNIRYPSVGVFLNYGIENYIWFYC